MKQQSNNQKTDLQWQFKQNVPLQMANSNAHQTIGDQLSYFWLGTGIFHVANGGLNNKTIRIKQVAMYSLNMK